ncbi:MAG: Histidine--tRNA ligase [Legionellaceae bacterium]
MTHRLQAIRGMKDVLPQEMSYWHFLENTLSTLLSNYGYQEIRFPIVEKTLLFKRSVGEVTDIVEKEMYTFIDRNEDSLSLRPEGTAGCVRACIENGLLYNQQQRLWYMGPMFRHERPQKGRYRQFHQCGVEAFGMAGPEIDVEIIAMSQRLWKMIGLKPESLTLQINSLGTSANREIYRQALIEYFNQYYDLLDEESQHRLHKNPLRILDSKNPTLANIIAQAPKLLDFLDEDSRLQFNQICEYLDLLGIDYQINSRLVRGLDYYNHLVFEWVTHELGAQGTICAGGRYDGLVEQLGGRSTPAIGFAIGLERLIELIQQTQFTVPQNTKPHIYLISIGQKSREKALLLAEKMHSALPNIRVIVDCTESSIKSQFKRADASQAEMALIIGENELLSQQIILKMLRLHEEKVFPFNFEELSFSSESVSFTQLMNYLSIAIK